MATALTELVVDPCIHHLVVETSSKDKITRPYYPTSTPFSMTLLLTLHSSSIYFFRRHPFLLADPRQDKLLDRILVFSQHIVQRLRGRLDQIAVAL